MCPFLYCTCGGPASPPASVLVSLFVCPWSFSTTPSSLSVFPPLLPSPSLSPPPYVAVVMPPPSLLPPSPASSTGYLPLCPQAQTQEH